MEESRLLNESEEAFLEPGGVLRVPRVHIFIERSSHFSTAFMELKAIVRISLIYKYSGFHVIGFAYHSDDSQ